MNLAVGYGCMAAITIGVPYFTIKSTWSKLSHYKILDKYPPSMEEEVKAIQMAITSRLYDLMTNGHPFDVVDVMAESLNIEVIAEGANFVMSMPNHPKYVLKSSSGGLYCEFSRFHNSTAFGLNYTATNCEGGVSPCFFGLAERVTFSQRLRHIIKKHHLSMIKVPKKVLVSFPRQLVPCGATPLHNKRVFVISKRYEIDLNAPIVLDELEQVEFVRQLKLFFEKAKGILDTHDRNFCFKGKKLLIFDTEKFHLDPFCMICVSAPLKEARIGLENMRRYFHRLPEGKGENLADLCVGAIEEIRRKERALLITRIGISLILVSLAYVSLQFLMLNFSARISR